MNYSTEVEVTAQLTETFLSFSLWVPGSGLWSSDLQPAPLPTGPADIDYSCMSQV